MAVFKFVIGEKGKSYQIEKDQKDCPVLGKAIGDKISGDFIGLEGYELEIKGGSDKDGFPMIKDVTGTVRKKIILKSDKKPTGFKKNVEGLRKRKTVRGNAIGSDIVQINCKIFKSGAKSLDDILGKKKEASAGKEEAPKEEKKK